MTYPPVHALAATGPSPRPQPVTAAAMIMLLSTLANFGMGLYIAFKSLQYATGSQAASQRMSAILVGLFAVAVGCAFAALALGILRGSKVSRILVFVSCGLVMCCGGISAVSLVAIMAQEGIEEPAQLVATILAFVNLVTGPLTALLLALPTSSRWFREVDAARKGVAHPAWPHNPS
jgi:hypothetical protein